MEGHGHHIRCKVSAPDGFTAVDLAVDKLERQMRKLKTKMQKRYRSHERPDIKPVLVPESLVGDSGEPSPPMYKIVKKKLFDVNSLDPQSAALQMDLLNHDFFLFNNAETDRAAVVYRRDDGNVGLIEVE